MGFNSAFKGLIKQNTMDKIQRNKIAFEYHEATLKSYRLAFFHNSFKCLTKMIF